MSQDIAPRTKTVKLKGGMSLTMHEPSMLDIEDGEKLVGRPYEEWLVPAPTKDNPDAKNLAKPKEMAMIFLWLMTRKDGVSPEDQAQKKWRMTFDVLRAQVTPHDLNELAGDIGACFYGGA